MARYSLVLPDVVYIKLVEIANKEQLSIGKLLNMIIKAWIEEYERGSKKEK